MRFSLQTTVTTCANKRHNGDAATQMNLPDRPACRWKAFLDPSEH